MTEREKAMRWRRSEIDIDRDSEREEIKFHKLSKAFQDLHQELIKLNHCYLSTQQCVCSHVHTPVTVALTHTHTHTQIHDGVLSTYTVQQF